MINRRNFLLSTAALTLAPTLTRAQSQDDAVFTLKAEPVKVDLLPDGTETQLWGFNGGSPGPILRMKQGQSFAVDLENAVEQPTAIHWHGLRIDNNMDGVPEVTQEPVAQGERYAYRLTPPDAGTYWYHSHLHSLEQVSRGLYGPIIVEEKNAPEVDHDIIAILDDWRISREGVLAEGFENGMDISHGGRLGNFAKVIFQDQPESLRKGERVRLRILNAATDRVFPIELVGLDGKIVALDGMPLANPAALALMMIAPGQRADIIADVVADKVEVLFANAQGSFALGELLTDGESERSTAQIMALPANPLSEFDAKEAVDVEIVMQGGMMSARTQTGTVWALSDRASMDDEPVIRAKRNQVARFHLINNTSFEHVIHVHGHHLRSEESLGLGPWRDGFLVAPGQTLKVVGALDNPGKWMIHCHMLAHQKGGMMTWFEVEA